MTYYGMVDRDDPLLGGGSFNDHDRGSEIENFKAYDGTCYGAVQIRGQKGGFNPRRLAGSADAEEIAGTLVVLVAKNPEKGGQVVVGWYRRATCRMTWAQREEHDPSAYGSYNFFAATKDCVLLPPASRQWPVPKGKGAMGQANVAYATDATGKPRRPRWMTRIIQQIAQYRGSNLLRGGRVPVQIGPAHYRRANERPKTAAAAPFERDPNVMDRALGVHGRTQNALEGFLARAELRTWSPRPHEPDFDLAWRTKRTIYVAEVKSLNARNEIHQLRIGLGQVLEYRHQMTEHFPHVKAVLAIPRPPKNERWVQICADVGVQLVWPETFEDLLPRRRRRPEG
jgi:hypothetical protein